MLQTFSDQYPRFIEYIFNGLNPTSPEFHYTESTIKDVEELEEILRGIEVSLGKLEQVFPQWETVRRVTIEFLKMYAVEIDEHHKNSNYAMLGGSVAGVVGGVCSILGAVAAVQTAGASMALMGVGQAISATGGVVSAGSTASHMRFDKAIRERVADHAKRDEQLTRQLVKELTFLDEYIGRLGRWVPMQQVNCGNGISKDFVKAGASVTSSLSKSLGLSTGALALLGAGILIDVALIIAIYNDSKSKTGEELRKSAEKLDRELSEVRKIYRKIENESKRKELKRQLGEKDRQLGEKDAEIEKLRTQRKLEQKHAEIEKLRTQRKLEEKDAEIEELRTQLKLVKKDAAIEKLRNQVKLEEKDAEIEELRTQLRLMNR